MLDKIVETVPDDEFRERKNIYRFYDYAPAGDVNLFHGAEAVCVTTGLDLLPKCRFIDLQTVEAPEESEFSKPVSDLPPAVFSDGVLTGQVIGISGRGSLITNIAQGDVEKLNVKEGETVTAVIKGHETSHRFYRDLSSAGNVASGEYLAIFNSGPALWLVKAYVGMTSDQPFEIGDDVRLANGSSAAVESGEE